MPDDVLDMIAMDKSMKAEKDRQWAAYMEEQKLK